MALHPVEEATLRAFVVAAKRDRLLTLFGNPKRRRQALNVLDHFDGWDKRFAQPLESTANVLVWLRKAGAPSTCHVISNEAELDGRDLPLDEAVSACEVFPFASVLCCVPGKLAFFYGEVYAPRERVLLQRRGGAG